MALLNYLSVSRFHGADAGAFLHSQLSADITALAPGEAVFACSCTPKGQVIGLLLVCRQKDDFLVAGSASLLPLVLDRLKMFVLRSRVEFAVEPDLKVHGIESKPGESVLEAFRPAGLGLSYQFSEDAGNDEQPADAFKALELAQRVTWLDTDTSEKFIPQMLGYEDIGAVSFSKGCYPGQEIVARTRYLGKVKRRPIIIRTGEPLAIKSAEHIDLLREETWSKAVVIDSAQDDGGTILFVVAPAEPEIGVREFKYQDRTYRSATM